MDIFAAPSILGPIVAGTTIGLVGWAGDLTYCLFGGTAGVLIGIGLMASKLVFSIEGMTKDVLIELENQANRDFEAKLDSLYKDLVKTEGAKDENLLEELRKLFNAYKENDINPEINEKMVNLFNACVEQLIESYALWKKAKAFSGELKKETLKNRDDLLKEIATSVKHFAKTLHELLIIEPHTDLAEMRKDIDQSVEIVKKTEERLSKLY